MAAWGFGFWMWRQTLGRVVLYLVSAEYSVVMCGARNLSDLTVASSQYDILLCSETLVSDKRHVSEMLVPGFCRPVLLCRGKMPRARGMAATFEMVTKHFANQIWVWLLLDAGF